MPDVNKHTPSIITLTTDFGLKDEYAGVMKGVILSINPEAVIVDISHDIPAQDIMAAGLMLKAAYGYFPGKTIHLSVVDPGVGSKRRIIGAKFKGQIFIAPDNGLLPQVFGDDSPDILISVKNSDFFLSDISDTFHGRDVFAPVAANLSKGIGLLALGPKIEKSSLKELPDQNPEIKNGKLSGSIISIDHFGNLITNIKAEDLNRFIEKGKNARIFIKGRIINGISRSYQKADPTGFCAIMASRAYLEIALFKGNAAKELGIEKGETVEVSTVQL